jgi:putative transposase
MSRQNFYSRRRARQRRSVDGDFVENLVKEERKIQPRLGTRKLHYLFNEILVKEGIKLGRDCFFDVLRNRGLLLEPKPSEYPRTTNSYHCLPVFTNRIKDLEVSKPNEVWVADLTYIRAGDGFLYLALVTDKVSRKILGYHCGDTLEAQGCIKALEKALGELPKGLTPIHHSDRGSQYCCHEYVNQLVDQGLGVSMTETNHCAENALAERMNGILKSEYGLGGEFKTKAGARVAVDQGVYLYNNRRPHTALGFKTPEQVHSLGA